jgi:hypothetical protein
MSVINIPFRNRSKHCVALIALKGHPERVYHYCKTRGEEYAWAVRDYLTERMVRSGDSKMTALQVEEEWTDYVEEPPSCPVKRIDFWKDYCQAASERHFGRAHVDLVTPNPRTLGTWKHMNGSRDLL